METGDHLMTYPLGRVRPSNSEEGGAEEFSKSPE